MTWCRDWEEITKDFLSSPYLFEGGLGLKRFTRGPKVFLLYIKTVLLICFYPDCTEWAYGQVKSFADVVVDSRSNSNDLVQGLGGSYQRFS